MIKKAVIFTLIVVLPLILSGPGLAQASSGLVIVDRSVEAEFPSKLRFSLSAESDVNITDIRLHYTVDRESYAEVTSEAYIEFLPDTTIDIDWTWDMRRTGGLPPGASVEYWWKVEDANGNEIMTTPVRVRFEDNRYSWQSLTEGMVTIYWYEGEKSFAGEIMLATQQALTRLIEDTGAYLKRPVRIYIYADSRDLQGAMIFPQEWTGGVAFTRYGAIAIGIGINNLDWGKRAITHELTHLVVHQMTFNPYSGLPAWLSEGLAMYAEGELEPEYRELLNKTIADGGLISVQSLSSPFSAFGGQASLSYAQSYSVIEFLITSYGQSKMLTLLNTFSQGSGYDGALEKVYGFDMENLDTLWRDYVGGQSVEAKVTATTPVLIETSTGMAAGLLSDFSLATPVRVGGWGW